MNVIDKIVSKQDITIDELENLNDEENEIVNYLIFSLTQNLKYFNKNNKIEILFNTLASKTIDDLECYKKYPIFYQKLIFDHGLSKCEKEKIYNYIKNYELNDYVTQKLIDINLLFKCDILVPQSDNLTIQILNEINKSKNIYDINKYDDMIKNIPIFKLAITIGMDEKFMMIYSKFKIIKHLKISTDNLIKLYYNKMNNYSDESLKYIKTSIALKYNAIMYNTTKQNHYADALYELQLAKLNEHGNYFALFDLIVICYYQERYRHYLDNIILDNVELLSKLCKSKDGNTLLPIIKVITNKYYQHISDKAKNQINKIYFNDSDDKIISDLSTLLMNLNL